jgi:hypothetical protein
MMRRIVLIRRREPLEEGWSTRSFAAAGAFLDTSIKVQGVQFDERYYPVRVSGRITLPADRPTAMGYNYGDVGPVTTFSVRSEFEDEEAIARLRLDRRQEVVGVYADPQVTVFPSPYCGSAAVGRDTDVARKLGVGALRKVGATGRRVRSTLSTPVSTAVVFRYLGVGPLIRVTRPAQHRRITGRCAPTTRASPRPIRAFWTMPCFNPAAPPGPPSSRMRSLPSPT